MLRTREEGVKKNPEAYGPFFDLPREIILEIACYFDTKTFLIFTAASASLRGDFISEVLRQHKIAHTPVAVGGDSFNTFFLTRAGFIYACGKNEDAWYGDAREKAKEHPLLVKSIPRMQSIVERLSPMLLLVSGQLLGPIRINRGGFDLIGDVKDRVLLKLSDQPIDIQKAVYFENVWLALTKTGDVYVMGKNDHAQLGTRLPFARDQLAKIEGLPVINDIELGTNSSFFITEEGRVFACGDNAYGRLGLNEVDELIRRPRELKISDIKQVCSRLGCTYFLTNSGDVYVCGQNTYGQLGVGHSYPVRQLVKLKLEFIDKMHLLHDGRCIYFSDKFGKLFACGDNEFGQLGIINAENQTQVLTPTLVPGAFNVHSVHDAGQPVIGITIFSQKNGKMFASGRYVNTLPGMSSVPEVINTVKEIPGLEGAVDFYATHLSHEPNKLLALVAMKANGEVWAFGSNSNGYLGFRARSASEWQQVTFPEVEEFLARDFVTPTPVSTQSIFSVTKERFPEGEPPLKRPRLGQ